MKFFFLFEFRDGSWGGGNQFLKALRKELARANAYAPTFSQSDVILFNSHHNIRDVVKARRQLPGTLFIHRVDGPMAYRGLDGEKVDKKISFLNRKLADGTVFQSSWSRTACYKAGYEANRFEVVIPNAPDPDLFYPGPAQSVDGRKIRLVSTGWSTDENKGAEFLRFLDEALDFSRYRFNFVGRSARKFKNINILAPMTSVELGKFLRSQDIFVFTSKYEACSNSLLEGRHCGLSIIALDSSSNPEVVEGQGELFSTKQDLLTKIEQVAQTLTSGGRREIRVQKIDQIGRCYIDFAREIKASVDAGLYSTKHWTTFDFIRSLI